ncbi:DEAD/DEAH box helicase [Amaricoccus macauensis]|uniref:DEAD/DEAH box helicase n=1 Tax=Amaricoccus macauensis TaxID=57001 RepID=UPI003C7ED10B
MTSFNDLSLDPRVLQAVTESGYTEPTPIQTQAIPHALAGRDVLGIAQTGTGKTASFVLPMLCHLSQGRARARMPRSLVLAPTRELAAQVAENFEKYSAHLKLSMALLIGGVSFKDQDRLIDRGVDVLIATPGRLLDHFERGKLMLTGVQIMVVDEADRMLDMGFIPDIERIFKLVPFTRQTLFFSATMAPEITRITEEFLHNPERVEVARQATTSETIEQAICEHTPSRKDRTDSEKREILRRLIAAEGDALTNGIVFCNRKRDVDIVAKSLKKHGLNAAALHGDLDQKLRMQILGQFRDGDLKLLIASDVAARGLDIPNVSHVYNYDVPIHSEDYVHRIGRTGRAGRTGKSVTLSVPSDEKYLAKIEELVKKTIDRIESPLAKEAPAKTERASEEAPVQKSETGRRSRGGSRGRSGGSASGNGGRQGRSSNGSRRGGGEVVVGMGDHVPAFLMRDFRGPAERDAAQEAAEAAAAETDAEAEPQAEAEASAETKKTPARKPRRASTRRSSKASEAKETSKEEASDAGESSTPPSEAA